MELQVQLPSPCREGLPAFTLPAEIVKEVDRAADLEGGNAGVGPRERVKAFELLVSLC